MVLRYVKGTLKLGLCYGKEDYEAEGLLGYVNSDYAACLDTRKSLAGYAFTVFVGAVSWKSSLQTEVVMSTTEAEYIAATEAVKEGIWFTRLGERT